MHDALVVGVPTFVVLLGILWNHQEIRELRRELSGRIDETNGRIDETNGRMDAGFTSLRTEMNTRLISLEGQMNTRLVSLEGQMNARFATLEGDLRQFYKDLGRHEEAIDAFRKRNP